MKNLLALFMLTISLTLGLSQATFASVQDEIDTTTVVEETSAIEKEVVQTTSEATADVKESLAILTKSLSNVSKFFYFLLPVRIPLLFFVLTPVRHKRPL